MKILDRNGIVGRITIVIILTLFQLLAAEISSPWKEYAHMGRAYYYNTITGKTQWEKPIGFEGLTKSPAVTNEPTLTVPEQTPPRTTGRLKRKHKYHASISNSTSPQVELSNEELNIASQVGKSDTPTPELIRSQMEMDHIQEQAIVSNKEIQEEVDLVRDEVENEIESVAVQPDAIDTDRAEPKSSNESFDTKYDLEIAEEELNSDEEDDSYREEEEGGGGGGGGEKEILKENLHLHDTPSEVTSAQSETLHSARQLPAFNLHEREEREPAEQNNEEPTSSYIVQKLKSDLLNKEIIIQQLNKQIQQYQSHNTLLQSSLKNEIENRQIYAEQLELTETTLQSTTFEYQQLQDSIEERTRQIKQLQQWKKEKILQYSKMQKQIEGLKKQVKKAIKEQERVSLTKEMKSHSEQILEEDSSELDEEVDNKVLTDGKRSSRRWFPLFQRSNKEEKEKVQETGNGDDNSPDQKNEDEKSKDDENNENDQGDVVVEETSLPIEESEQEVKDAYGSPNELIENLRHENQQLQENNTVLDLLLQDRQAYITNYQSNLERLENYQRNSEVEIKGLSEKIMQLQVSKDQLQNTLHAKEKEMQQSQSQLDEYELAIGNLTATVKEQQQQYEQRINELREQSFQFLLWNDQLHQMIFSLQEENDIRKFSLFKLSETIDELTTRYQDLEIQTSNITQEMLKREAIMKVEQEIKIEEEKKKKCFLCKFLPW
eukprot:gene2560-2722_t